MEKVPVTSIAIPPVATIRKQLEALRYSQLERLAALSGTKFRTLIKIRNGETANPGIETVRAFWQYIDAVSADPTTQPGDLS